MNRRIKGWVIWKYVHQLATYWRKNVRRMYFKNKHGEERSQYEVALEVAKQANQFKIDGKATRYLLDIYFCKMCEMPQTNNICSD